MGDGALGFDVNQVVGAEDARRFRAAGYDFALRYVRRTVPHSFDLSKVETLSLLDAGLAVMPVQHVAPPGWLPSASLGLAYGETAGAEATAAGIPAGVNLWCDLEGVQTGCPPSAVIDYLNEWHEAAERAGFLPGLYIGDQCGLSGAELYKELRFRYYWMAYNANSDVVPAVRGACMRQHPYPRSDLRVPGIAFEYDEDVIRADALGNSPVLYLSLVDPLP